MRKKFLTVAAVALAVSVMACGKQAQKPGEDANTPTVSIEVTSTPTPTDMGFIPTKTPTATPTPTPTPDENSWDENNNWRDADDKSKSELRRLQKFLEGEKCRFTSLPAEEAWPAEYAWNSAIVIYAHEGDSNMDTLYIRREKGGTQTIYFFNYGPDAQYEEYPGVKELPEHALNRLGVSLTKEEKEVVTALNAKHGTAYFQGKQVIGPYASFDEGRMLYVAQPNGSFVKKEAAHLQQDFFNAYGQNHLDWFTEVEDILQTKESEAYLVSGYKAYKLEDSMNRDAQWLFVDDEKDAYAVFRVNSSKIMEEVHRHGHLIKSFDNQITEGVNQYNLPVYLEGELVAEISVIYSFTEQKPATQFYFSKSETAATREARKQYLFSDTDPLEIWQEIWQKYVEEKAAYQSTVVVQDGDNSEKVVRTEIYDEAGHKLAMTYAEDPDYPSAEVASYTVVYDDGAGIGKLIEYVDGRKEFRPDRHYEHLYGYDKSRFVHLPEGGCISFAGKPIFDEKGRVLGDTMSVIHYGEKNRIVSIAVDDGVTEYRYDDKGRLLSYHLDCCMLEYYHIYTYDKAGRVLTKTAYEIDHLGEGVQRESNRSVCTYSYDAAGRISSIAYENGPVELYRTEDLK